jgi:hypothetical protein
MYSASKTRFNLEEKFFMATHIESENSILDSSIKIVLQTAVIIYNLEHKHFTFSL